MPSDHFSSQVPSHLLENETPAMKYLITELSKNTQATEFLLQKREESGKILDEISRKLDYTNGSIGEAKRDIFELQGKVKRQDEIREDIEQIVTAKKFAEKYLLNKYAIALVVIFVIGTIKVFTNDDLRTILFHLVGIA